MARLSRAIAGHLTELPEWRAARTVHVYVGAVDGEVETRPAIARALAEGKRVLCPRVVRRPRGLESYAIRSLDDLAPGTRGLWEPDPARAERTDEAPDLIVVPGLAFDRSGGRIGYGAGFYDRLLAVTPGVRAALAYSLQLIEEIPVEPHDAVVHWLVTERGAVDCRAARRSGSPEEAR